jgi:hypothetical protein
MSHPSDHIPLRISLCDPDESDVRALEHELRHSKAVQDVTLDSSLEAARRTLRSNDINSVIIDPLGFDLDAASGFVFDVRRTLPEIVFVLYIDKAAAEKRRGEFYRGERRRFTHYYTLDKGTTLQSFPDEAAAVINLCQTDLSWRISRESLDRLLKKTERLIASGQGDVTSLEEYRGILSRMPSASRDQQKAKPKSVFLSHRFAESDYVSGLMSLLEKSGFNVVTGKSASSFIGKAVLRRIQESEFFVCLLTRAEEKADGTYTTSSWLFQELGAAIAFGKKFVLMVEDGVTDLGGLQGDWQRIHFGAKGFLNAALEAVEQLRSYAGES